MATHEHSTMWRWGGRDDAVKFAELIEKTDLLSVPLCFTISVETHGHCASTSTYAIIHIYAPFWYKNRICIGATARKKRGSRGAAGAGRAAGARRRARAATAAPAARLRAGKDRTKAPCFILDRGLRGKIVRHKICIMFLYQNGEQICIVASVEV